ncbi:hypothetical protein GCM10020295_65240 [Streptomyces cinereospinus]
MERGIYVVGDRSWSIDMQRYNFQFTGQRAYAIRNGRLDGQVRDFAYQGVTPQFWGSLEAVGGPPDLRARRGFQLRKGPTRAGRLRVSRMPVSNVPGCEYP